MSDAVSGVSSAGYLRRAYSAAKSGASKAAKYIEEKTGIDLSPELTYEAASGCAGSTQTEYVYGGNLKASVTDGAGVSKALAQQDDVIAETNVQVATVTVQEGNNFGILVPDTIEIPPIKQGEGALAKGYIRIQNEGGVKQLYDSVFMTLYTRNGKLDDKYKGAAGAVGLGDSIDDARLVLKVTSDTAGGFLIMQNVVDRALADSEIVYHDLSGNEIKIDQDTDAAQLDPNQIQEFYDPDETKWGGKPCPALSWITDPSVATGWVADPVLDRDRSADCHMWSNVAPADDTDKTADAAKLWEYNPHDQLTNNDDNVVPTVNTKVYGECLNVDCVPGSYGASVYAAAIGRDE